MKIFTKILLAATFGLGLIGSTMAATSPSLGTAATFGLLANTFNYNIGPTNIIGTLGTSVLGYVAAFPGGGGTLLVTGLTEVNNAARVAAGAAQNAALNNVVDGLNVQVCVSIGAIVDLASYDMDGAGPMLPGHFTPGCYSSTNAMNIGGGGTVTLDGAGTYIFKPNGALGTSAGSTVTLNGASACDVFWAPVGATTIGANSTFVGSVLDAAGITIGNNVTRLGRALAFGGTITADTDTITVPNCATPTLRVIKSVTNNNGGTAISSTFNLHVTLGGIDVAGSPALGTVVGTLYTLTAGTYVVSEDANASYTSSFGGSCNAGGSVSLLPGDAKTCTITNDDVAPPSGGGGGGGSLSIDSCPDGDYSPSYYDNICGTVPTTGVIVTPVATTGHTSTTGATTTDTTTTVIPGLPKTGAYYENGINQKIAMLALGLLLLSSSFVILRKRTTGK